MRLRASSGVQGPRRGGMDHYPVVLSIFPTMIRLDRLGEIGRLLSMPRLTWALPHISVAHLARTARAAEDAAVQ